MEIFEGPKFTACNLSKKITMLNAVHMAARAWTSVSRKTVINCFKKALGSPKLAESINSDDFLTEVPIPQNMSADVFYDQIDLPMENDFSEEQNESDEEEEEEDIEDSNENRNSKPVATIGQCFQSIQEMRNNFEIAGAEEAIFNSLNLLENEIVKIKINQSSKQRRMTDHFAPMPTVNTEEEILELCKSLEGSGLSDKINLNSSNVCTSCEENLTGSYQCSDCDETLCVKCFKAHSRLKLTRTHIVTPL